MWRGFWYHMGERSLIAVLALVGVFITTASLLALVCLPLLLLGTVAPILRLAYLFVVVVPAFIFYIFAARRIYRDYP